MKKLFLSGNAVSISALWLSCLLLFIQCDIWNKPLLSTIQDKIDELKSIKTILVTKYPYPNTFMAGDETPYKMSAQEWVDKHGLEISGINDLNGARVLEPGTEYTVEAQESGSADGYLPVTVTLAGGNGDDGVTTEFRIDISRRNETFYKIAEYNGTNGKAIPFPSQAAAGQKVSVYVYPEQGFILKENGLSYQMFPPASNGNPVTAIHGGVFDMPAYDIGLNAAFEDISGVEAMRISGGKQQYYTSLADAVYGAGTAGVVYVLAENIFIDKEISIEGAVDLTLTALPGLPKIIQRKQAAGGAAFTGSLFTVKSGASLTLDAGSSPGFVVDGGRMTGISAEEALVTVSGGSLTIGDRVILQNNSNGSTSGNSNGGAVYVSGGVFSMEGGVIQDNVSVLGGGVYNDGVFNIVGKSVVTQDNDVYLTDGKLITVSGSLTPPGGLTARITTQAQANGSPIVLSGITARDTAKFTVSEAGNMIVLDGAGQGKIVSAAASRGSAAVIYYQSLQEAVSAAAGTASMPDTITVLENIELEKAISGIDGADKHIRLTVPNGASYTITRGAHVTDSLFSVKNGASLTLGGGSASTLTIDGGAKWSNAAGGPKASQNDGITSSRAMVTVNGGTLTIEAGAALQNNHNTSSNTSPESPGNGGGVYVTNGAVFMKGGEIKANKGYLDSSGDGCLGGGVFLHNNSYFLMSGDAKISGNYAKWGGGVGLKSS